MAARSAGHERERGHERGRASSIRRAVSIRQASEADLEQVLALYHEFHEFHVRGVPERLIVPTPYDDEAAHATLVTLLHSDDAALFVADDHERLQGLAEVYLRRDPSHPATISYVYGHLQSLIVTAPRRRLGLGQRLVAAAEAWSLAHGATEMRLSCWEFADGPLTFYETLGYRTMKRTLVRPLA